MRAVRYHEHGGPEVLRIETVPEPAPRDHEVLIDVEAVGANAVDAAFRAGRSPWPWPLPATVTGDVVGRVVAAGAGVTTAAVGDRVAALTEDAFAERVTADAAWLAPVPADADAAEATALSMIAPLARGLLHAARFTAGESVLVQSAAGGVGHLLVQLALHFGAARVIGVSSTEDKRAFVRSLGADAVAVDDLPAGVDVVFDSVGGKVFDAGVDALAPGGRIVTYGAIGGELATANARSLIAVKSVTGFSFRAWQAAFPDRARADMAEVAGLWRAGVLRSAVHARLPFERVAAIHEILDGRANIGRVVALLGHPERAPQY